MPNRHSDAFQRALDEARRKDGVSSDDLGLTGAPRVRGVAFGATPGSGGKARFGLALEWTDEPAERPTPPPQLAPREAARHLADTAAEIAAELGLSASLTLSQLTSRWRKFVWRNHPDRQPAEAQARANARVATANALYEQARRELAEKR